MRRFAHVLVALVFMALVVAGVAQAAPRWTRTAGLDFWNVGKEEAKLSDALNEGRNLEEAQIESQQRVEFADHVAFRLAEEHLSLDEAVDSIATFPEIAPRWFEQVKLSYHGSHVVQSTATDRDLLACYLLLKIRTMLLNADRLGDHSRAVFLSTRLDRLKDEAHLPLPSRPNPALDQ